MIDMTHALVVDLSIDADACYTVVSVYEGGELIYRVTGNNSGTARVIEVWLPKKPPPYEPMG